MRHLFAICLCTAGLLSAGAQESQAQFYGAGTVRQACCYGNNYAANYSSVTSYYAPYTSYYVPLTAYYGGASACCATSGCNTCGTSSCCPTTAGYAPAQNCCGTNACCASTGCCSTRCTSGCATGCCGANGCASGNCVTGGNIDRRPTTVTVQRPFLGRTIATAPPQTLTKSADTWVVNAESIEVSTPLVQRATLRSAGPKAAASKGWEPIR